MNHLKNAFITMISILIVACASFMFIPTMGMIVTFSTNTYFELIYGTCMVLNTIISIIITISYIAVEYD